MAVAPQKVREAVFQMLFSYDMSLTSDATIIDLLSQELALPKSVLKRAHERVQIIIKHLKEIDALIAETSLSYDFERIQRVEKNILRLGVYEILFDPKVSKNIIFSESTRLATKFSTKESASFINAILDAIAKKSSGEAIDNKEINLTIQKMEESEMKTKTVIDSIDKER